MGEDPCELPSAVVYARLLQSCQKQHDVKLGQLVLPVLHQIGDNCEAEAQICRNSLFVERDSLLEINVH